MAKSCDFPIEWSLRLPVRFEGPLVASEHSLQDSIATYEAVTKQLVQASSKQDRVAKPEIGLNDPNKINISGEASRAETVPEWRFKKVERGRRLLA